MNESTLIVDPVPKLGVDEVGGHRFEEARPFYDSVLPQLVGMLVHRLVQKELTDPEQSAGALTSFIDYCDSLNPVNDKKLGTEILLPEATAIARKVSEQLKNRVKSNGVWLAEIGFTQSQPATEQLRLLITDGDVLQYITSQGYPTIDAYAKSIIQGPTSPKGPLKRFAYSPDVSTYTIEQKIVLLNAILGTYGHYDYGQIAIPEVSLTVNARADLIHLACSPEDSRAHEVINGLKEASRHHLHSIPLKGVLNATAQIDTHFANLKEAASMIIEGRIVCTFVEIKTQTTHPDNSKPTDKPAPLQQPETIKSGGESEYDPNKMRDLSHTVLAAVQVLAQFLSFAENPKNGTSDGSGFQKLTSLSLLLSRPYGEKIQLLRELWPVLRPIVEKQQFIMTDVEWPVTNPQNPSRTTTTRPTYEWDIEALEQSDPAIDSNRIPPADMSRWVMRHGAHLIERWLQSSRAPTQETGITAKPIGVQEDGPSLF